MNMTNNINPLLPSKIKAFVRRVITVPAPNFSPWVCAESVDIQAYESNYSVVFFGLKKEVNMSLIYPWIPIGFRCSGVAFMDNSLTLDIKEASINPQKNSKE